MGSHGAELLQIVREQPDGTLEWQEPLGAPGVDRCVVLADLDAAAMMGATEFEATPSGEWLVTVADAQYSVLPGVIPKTGQFVFIGVETWGPPHAGLTRTPPPPPKAKRVYRWWPAPPASE